MSIGLGRRATTGTLALILSSLMSAWAPLRHGGERIVLTFVCPEPSNATFWVYERASGELRGDSEPGDCRVEALFNFESGEVLDVYAGARPSERVRCRHRFDDVPADYLWGYEHVALGAPWQLRCGP